MKQEILISRERRTQMRIVKFGIYIIDTTNTITPQTTFRNLCFLDNKRLTILYV